MKNIPLATLVYACFTVLAFAQNVPTTEPPELATRREGYQRDLQRAAAPIMTNYLRSLEPLKQQFNREGKLEAALAVDNEIKKVTKDLEQAAATPTTNAISSKPTIVSAIYGEVSGTRTVDISDNLREAMTSGLPGLKLNTGGAAKGKDPAMTALKQTTITYTIHGQTKKKVFPEGYNLKFKDDLK